MRVPLRSPVLHALPVSHMKMCVMIARRWVQSCFEDQDAPCRLQRCSSVEGNVS